MCVRPPNHYSLFLCLTSRVWLCTVDPVKPTNKKFPTSKNSTNVGESALHT